MATGRGPGFNGKSHFGNPVSSQQHLEKGSSAFSESLYSWTEALPKSTARSPPTLPAPPAQQTLTTQDTTPGEGTLLTAAGPS